MNPSPRSFPFGLTASRRTWTRRRIACGLAVVNGLALAAACGGKDDLDPSTLAASENPAGNAGSAGSAGAAGAAGAGGAGADVALGGSAGAAGSASTVEAAGAAGSSAAGTVDQGSFQGAITVLNDDATALHGPTSAAVRGNSIWIVNGQLSQIGGSPILPFNVVSIPLEGGPVDRVGIELTGDDFFPEGIAAARDGRLFIGSVERGTIVRVARNAVDPDAEELVVPGIAERGVTGLAVDERRDAIWFCDSNPTAPGGDIVEVDIDTGLELVRHAMPDPGAVGGEADAGVAASVGDAGAPPGVSTFCNDLVVTPRGDIFATDSSGRVFRVDSFDAETAGDATVWLDSPAISVPGGVGANGIELLGTHLIIASGGSLIAVDSISDDPAASLQVLAIGEDGAPATLCGPDGLRAVPNSVNELIVVENGSCDTQRARVISVRLAL